jgi:DNA polymerase III subunit delta
VKIAIKELESFFRNPPPAMRAALIYGADGGVVRARRDALLKTLGIQLTDPFTCTELAMDDVEETPSLLFEAMQSISMMGGNMCVMLSGAGHKLTDHVKAALANPACANVLIITAGDLVTGSLRTLFEDVKRKDCIALPCYRDEGGDLAVIIRQFLQSRQIVCGKGAMEALAASLGNDRAVTMGELEKIDLYLGQDRTLTEEIVFSLLSNNQHMALSDAVLSWFEGDISRCMRLLDRLFREGEHPVAFIRILLITAGRILAIQQKITEGMGVQQAMKYGRPPVFYKEEPRYIRALKRFSTAQLLHLIGYANSMEAALKRTATPELVVMQGLCAYPS